MLQVLVGRRVFSSTPGVLRQLQFIRPCEYVRLLKQLVERHSLLTKLVDEPAYCCNAACEPLYVLQACRAFDVEDGLDFPRVRLDSAMRNDEAQQIAGWYPEDALLWVQHHVVFLVIVEGFLQVSDKII